ncbi:MAG: helix-turn-helix domain-containing protein [Mesorhizobium sp.]|nr:helix-turn-helix domain-containing protein [Mesorhizobium sp.]MCO5163109.1 helix-turn-helix domain-containing protein [Mesorhizobium sp.]
MTAHISPASVPEYRLYREARGEAGDFWIHCEPLPERSRLHRFEIGAHRHPSLFQIFLVTDGEGEIVDGRTAIRFAAPAILFIPSGEVHGFRFAASVDGIVLTALADRLASLAATDRTVAAFASAMRVLQVRDGLDATLRRIDREMQDRSAGRATALEALVALAVIDLARAWLSAQADGEVASGSQDTRAQALETLISTHYRHNLPAVFYAERLGVSVSQLNRIARAVTGQTLQGLIARRVTEAACRDLVFTPTPVSGIAESLGFADPAYFNRFFRKQTGMTPGAYRARERARL